MTFETVAKRIGFVGFVCSGLMLGSAAVSQGAAAQGIDDQPNSVEELQPVPPNATDDQPNSVEELRPAPASDRVSRLRRLQSTVINRETNLSPLAQPGIVEDSGISESTPPLPEQREAITVALPVNEQLSVDLMNDTGALLTYEVVGDTARRELMAGESAMLQGISLPATITLVRQDEGLIEVMTDVSEEGVLKVMISPDASLDDTQGVLRIQEDGQVFVY